MAALVGALSPTLTKCPRQGHLGAADQTHQPNVPRSPKSAEFTTLTQPASQGTGTNLAHLSPQPTITGPGKQQPLGSEAEQNQAEA